MAVYFISLRLLMPFLKIELAMLFFYNGLGAGLDAIIDKEKGKGRCI